MTTTVPIAAWKPFYRVAKETAWNTNTATADWPIGGNGGGANGWRDMPALSDRIVFNPTINPIFPSHQSGARAMNNAAPIAGAYSVPGTFELIPYPELLDLFLETLLGSTTRTPTAGAAALASTAFASVATLDTQPNGTEQLKFVLASSTASSSATINIIQSAVTVETITIGTSASSVDGDYYSKGAYDGTANAITFTVSGTVTSGLVVISGIDLNTNVHTPTTTQGATTLKVEEGGLPRSGSNSFFYNGVIIPSMTFSYDRTALDGMFAASGVMEGRYPSAATAGAYADDGQTHYNPYASWTASLLKDGAAFDKIQTMSLTVAGGNALFPVSSGAQQPDGAFAGRHEVTGTLGILSEDNTEWAAFDALTVQDYHILFTSPLNIVDSTKYTLLFELSELYFEAAPTVAISNGLVLTTIPFRTTNDASDGSVKITNVCRMPI